ncbi:MAG: hypothetical protein HY897_24585 [Deltaproteobacteria bacterium]|nr:hypothetical protein [Deltaproteobacteria bacterium]
MDKVLAIKEIEARYKSEWVLVEDPTTDETLEIRSGKVVCHSKDRDEVYRVAASRKPRNFAVLYTGRMPKDAAIIL